MGDSAPTPRRLHLRVLPLHPRAVSGGSRGREDVRAARRLRKQRERSDNARELLAWYDEQAQLVMTLLREVARERAAEFERTAGLVIDVEWPSHPPINLTPEGPFMSFMRLRIPEREVHLYSHRVAMGAPLIHFVAASPRPGEHSLQRLLSRPGCRIEQREGGGFLLRSVGGEADGSVVSVDDIAYRAFALLLAES